MQPFVLVTDAPVKQARVFVLDKFLKTSITFVGKARSQP